MRASSEDSPRSSTSVSSADRSSADAPQSASNACAHSAAASTRWRSAQQDAAREVEESSEVADDVEESAKKAPGSCRPGRGFAGRAYPVRRQEKSEPASTTQDEKDEKAVEPAAREQKPVEPQLEVDAEAKGQQPTDERTEQGASSKPRRRRHRGGRSSHAETATEKTTPQNEDAKAEVSSGQPKRQPAKESKSVHLFGYGIPGKRKDYFPGFYIAAGVFCH